MTQTVRALLWDMDGVVVNSGPYHYRAYREVLSKDFPARATIGLGLMNADGQVEIMMTAVK